MEKRKAGDRVMRSKAGSNPSVSRLYAIILVLFFFSGISALAYQVIWVKIVGLVFGVAPFAVSTVLSSFMAGLTLGSLYFGRAVDRSRNPLKLFGLMEMGIGVFALLFPFLLSRIIHSYAYLYLHFHTSFYFFSLLRFLMIFSLLLVPTFLMGGTLPVLSKFSIWNLKVLGRRVGSLYSVNNFGAAAGCFLTGFFLIRLIGLSNGIYLAAAINISIAVGSLVLSKLSLGFLANTRPQGTNSPMKGAKPTPQKEKKGEHYSRFLVYILLVIFTISGFISLVYEVLWTRILSASVLANSVYSFSAVVITFIVGLAVGSFIYARFVDRKWDKLILFGLIEAGIGVSALLLLPAFARVTFIVGSISVALFGSAPSWGMCAASEFVPAFLLMIIPTTLMGMTFPLISRIYTRSLSKLGRRIGEINSLDTAGPVFGSFAGGFLFIPWFGMQKSILALSLLSIGMGGIVIYFNPHAQKKLKWALISLLAVIMVVSTVFIPRDLNFWRKGRIPGERLLYYREDAAATVVVREYPQGGRLNRVMEVDGTDVAGTDYMLRSTQKLQGHVPLLIHKDPQKVLIVGFGSGGTTWAVSQHNVKRIDAVELVPSVVEGAAKYFAEVNHEVLDDPRLNIKIGDGRNFVLTTQEKYDVILTESIHPIYAGNGNLYSREYFELCKQKLTQNGVMSVWIPLWALPEQHFKMIIETFREIFPHSTLWYVANCLNRQVYLIGGKDKLKIDFQSLQTRMSHKNINQDLQQIGLEDTFLLTSSFIMGGDSLERYAKGARVNSDNYPFLEYFDYPYLEFFPSESFHVRTVYENLSSIQEYKEEVTPFLINIGSDEEVERIEQQLSIYSESTEHTIKGITYSLRGKLKQAIQEFERALEINAQDKSAERLLTHLLEYIYVNRGNELQYKGDIEGAIVSYKTALEVNPNSSMARYNLALTYLRKGMGEEAKIQLKKALQINPQIETVQRLLDELGDPEY